jgi:acetyl/propionyl-CoA carboxylase alpha subunit/acetyl-CoA carboxylase carboxyltransferase component
MLKHILIANRGEVALRVAQAAADLGAGSVAVVAQDDPQQAHTRAASRHAVLPGRGPAAYLDIGALLDVARRTGCDAVHPGYGFLSERPDFAQACADAGLVFIGPTPQQLALLGDKVQARALAIEAGVPVLPGSEGPVDLAQAQAFMAAQGGAPVMVKAVGGGGGRGLRVVRDAAEMPAAFARCAAEAQAAFGLDAVYVERWLPQARHLEVQVLGDGAHCIALGERECTLQRQHQKLVEWAPSPSLPPALRTRLTQAALALAQRLQYRSLGTFEFLLDPDGEFFFIEANARLQVEHTVTELVTGLDLVQLQIAQAAGATLTALGLDPQQPPPARGHAVQWRINAETLDAQGRSRPAQGTATVWQLPGGPGVRVDTQGHAGVQAAPAFDSLLAKLVVHSGGTWADVLRRSQRALAQCQIEGLATNLPLLRALAARPELLAMAGEATDGPSALHTGFVEQQLAALWPQADAPRAGDPAYELRAPLAGRLVAHEAAVGDTVPAGRALAVLEAMKMQHELAAPQACQVQQWLLPVGAQVQAGQLLALLQPAQGAEDSDPGGPTTGSTAAAGSASSTGPRADLQQVLDRHALTLDGARPQAVAARHARGQRTARENLAALCDDGSFNEYGALAVAAQSRRRSAQDLIENTPADGLVTGTGSVNRALFGPERARTALLAYDATVLAGTQGFRNHQKTDRLLGLALQNRLPVVLWAEGGGGRPGDVDMPVVAGLHVPTFARFAQLSGQVPLVGIAAGRCFAGNAALLGCCDVVIATRGSNIGMGGPAMIEGGGLGVFKPEQVGSAEVQHANGVIDVLVDDEVQAADVARRYLGFFQGSASEWTEPDAQALRQVVPENRLRVYDVRRALQHLFDEGSVLELRAGFGAGIVTALARIEGRAVGVLANNPLHLGGAIDPDAADKAARFMQLCNAHGLPLLSLVDTPGFMVGPGVEAQAQVRHASRLFVVGASLRVPCVAVVLRKGYGLGAMAMTAGGFHATDATVSWPTGEFGGMGLEGAVRLGYRKELAAAHSDEAREALFRQLLASQVDAGGALNMAATLEIDAVIDPAQTRPWLVRALAGARVRAAGPRFIDTW